VLYAVMVLLVGSLPNLQPPVSFSNADKLAHVLEYLGLGALLTRACRATWNAPAAPMAAICLGILVGTCDEWHQAFVPGRSSSGLDLLADTVGLGLAPLALRAFVRS
jgi:VanZ family protein